MGGKDIKLDRQVKRKALRDQAEQDRKEKEAQRVAMDAQQLEEAKALLTQAEGDETCDTASDLNQSFATPSPKRKH